MSVEDDFIAAQQRVLKHYGVEAKSEFLETPAIGRVHALVCGEGPPVVMVPGFSDPAAMWAPLMAQLPGFKLHAVDRPGFGLTARAVYSTTSFRTLAVEYLTQVLDALRLERPFLIGNSIGSLWAIWFALERPERVAGMVHIGCPAFILGTSAPFPMRLLSVPPVGWLAMNLAPPSPKQVEQFAQMIGENLSEAEEIRNLLVANQKLPNVTREIRRLLHSVVRLRGARPAVALNASELRRLQQPVELIWGPSDAFGDIETGRKAAREIPNAELRVLTSGGHVPWLNKPSEVGSAAAEFMRANEGLAS